MDAHFLETTNMLDFHSDIIENLIESRDWRSLEDYDRIKAIYEYVQNEILFGYNRSDTLHATEVLLDGYGQCNTKATLLMALLRGCGIACRLHGFELTKDFQRGVTNWLVSALAPARIIHTWVEVYYLERWIALEGVIMDRPYIEGVKAKCQGIQKQLRRYAIATDGFEHLSIEWYGADTYVQQAAIVTDFGTFCSPDTFFQNHRQHLSKLKNFMYVQIGRKMMNRNVFKIRNFLQ